MKKINGYTLLSMLPVENLHSYSRQAILKEMESRECRAIDAYSAEAHKQHQEQVMAFFDVISREHSLPDFMVNAWNDFYDFMSALRIEGAQTDQQQRLFSTFQNYVDTAIEVDTYCHSMSCDTPNIVEIAPGYGFSSFILSELGHNTLCLAPHGDVSPYSWIIDRFMKDILPIKFKDTLHYTYGSLKSVCTKFSGIDILFASGLPVFFKKESLKEELDTALAVIMDMLTSISPAGILILNNQHFFSADYNQVQRKAMLFHMAELLQQNGFNCLSVGINKKVPSSFPREWNGYDLSIVIQNG